MVKDEHRDSTHLNFSLIKKSCLYTSLFVLVLIFFCWDLLFLLSVFSLFKIPLILPQIANCFLFSLKTNGGLVASCYNFPLLLVGEVQFKIHNCCGNSLYQLYSCLNSKTAVYSLHSYVIIVQFLYLMLTFTTTLLCILNWTYKDFKSSNENIRIVITGLFFPRSFLTKPLMLPRLFSNKFVMFPFSETPEFLFKTSFEN